ncbi:MAG TPA: LPS assembly lipoprotein LptE [Nevskiaceae bacterium]|nr:LPS assembly lipoprotein LptE [Nevskiaceae bacterium]
MIQLSDLFETRSVLSIGADGKALEYQLTTSVRYLVSSGGKALLAPDVLTASRDYSYNATQVLAKEAEESRLREFIQNELAELLLLRLEAGFAHLPAAADGTLTPADVPAVSPGAPPGQ